MRLLVSLAFILTALGACGGEDEESPSELTGVITAIQNGSGPVRSFALETDGETYEILIDPQVDYGFDLRHLYEHRDTGDPVRCSLEERGERLYALEIVDAPPGT